MSGSIKIGSAFGIPVRIHLTFLLLVYALVLFTADPLVALGLIVVVFGCVLLHELGHSLVARSFGLRVADITLWPLGGMARMSEIPENARIEAWIAVAGPIVNFALAGLGVIALAAGAAFGLQPDSGPERFLSFFLLANVVQGGFNLLPAFPMDGGRLLRAFLARKRDWLSATEVAVRVGRALALVLFLGSLVFLVRGGGFCLMPIVALFVWFEGTRELWSVRLRHGVLPLGGLRTAFGRARPGAAGAPSAAWTTATTGTTGTTGSAGAPAPPPPEEPLEPGVARRPRTWLSRLSRRGGFSADEIRRLEAHRAPLRRPPDEA